jgi:hypothetical protein
MSSTGDEQDGSNAPRPRWSDRVDVAQNRAGVGFAFVPGHVLFREDPVQARARREAGEPTPKRGAAEGRAQELAPKAQVPVRKGEPDAPVWQRMTDVDDPIEVIGVMRSEGYDAQPEHVFFAHDCTGCESAPHPSVHMGTGDWDFGANPYRANPYRANPYRANPYRANPYRANPYRANPYRANEAPMSSAEPAMGSSLPDRPELPGPGRHARITILDTGIADGVDDKGNAQRPALLPTARIAGDTDHADAEIAVVGTRRAPIPADGYLDPVAGHGTFIAGIIEQLAKGCTITVDRVIQPLGDGPEMDIINKIEDVTALSPNERPDIVSMSFGGAVFEKAFALHTAIAAARHAGIVLVASAGNEGICVPQYPAAFPEVIGVGAVGPDGPPPWTNYGDWVDACAPGVELVSSFFALFDGKFPMMNSVDIDKFAEWACWSGTSFSGPVVVAALAREMVIGDCNAAEAVQRVINAPHLLRLPCLGTVVNL